MNFRGMYKIEQKCSILCRWLYVFEQKVSKMYMAILTQYTPLYKIEQKCSKMYMWDVQN
jgi:hypothetical protein